MMEDVILPVSTATTTSSSIALKKNTTTTSSVSDHLSRYCFVRGRYKIFALAAIILLAFWSMLAGIASLCFSTDISMHDSIELPLPDDLDALELDERVKFVKRMWDVYVSENKQIRLSKFWQQAFEAAYELLINDGLNDPQAVKVREDAISEIAKMSVLRIPVDPPPAVDSLVSSF